MQVTDPVCGMKIDSATASATEVVNGRTLYFCSPSCRDEFHANPAKYAKPESGEMHDSHHCC